MKDSRLKKITKQIQKNEAEGARNRFHSNAYHRYFEGYSEYYAPDDSGKPVLKRVYTGDWYSCDLPPRSRVYRQLVQVLFWLAAAALFVFCASRPDAGNNQWYVIIPEIGAIFGLAWTAFGLFSMLTAPKRMTVGDWKASSLRLRNGSLCAAVFFTLTGAMTLLDLFLRSGGGTHLLCCAGFLLCGALAALMNRLEAGTAYSKTPSGEVVPKEAARIR